MEDNKIIPEMDNSADAEDAQTNAEPAVDAEAVEPTVEESVDTAEVETEVVEPVTEAEVDLGQPEAPVKKKKKGWKIALGIIVGLLLCVVALIVAAIIIVNNASKLSVDADEPAITIDDVEVNAGEYVYMYSYFSNYYSSYYTSEQLEEYATEQLVYVNSLYKKAVDAGYTLSEEDYAEIDEVLASVEQQAESYSITVDEMIEDYYFCDGYTAEMFKKYLEKEYLANKYYTEAVAEIQDKYAGDNGLTLIEDEYKNNRTEYDLSNASYAYFDATEDGAQATVDSIIAKVKGGTSFADAIDAVEDAESKSLKGYTNSVVETNFSADVAKWLFAMENGEYTNGAGAITSITDGDVIYVIYAEGEPYRDEQIPVTVDYIVVNADTDTTVKSEDELLLAAKATASGILKEFEETEKTSNDFFALEDTYNNGDNELVSGSYYEDMTDDGTYDEALAEWAFDASRKVGDYALVAGDGCYYVVYFTAKDENAVWYQTISETLINEDVTSWSESVVAEFEDVTVKHDDVIAAVIEYVTANSSASYY